MSSFQVAALDFNKDGLIDFVTSDNPSDAAFVLQQSASGFDKIDISDTEFDVRAIKAADINGDGEVKACRHEIKTTHHLLIDRCCAGKP